MIGDDFGRMARALNLMKIGAASGGGAGLAVTAELRRARFDPATETVDEASRGPVDTGNVPRMAPNDVVVPYIENRTDGPVDYNILYVGSDYSISFIANGRMNPGEKVTTDENAVLISDRAFGRDRMIVVLSPAVDGTEIEDSSFLEEDTLNGNSDEQLAATSPASSTAARRIPIWKACWARPVSAPPPAPRSGPSRG